MHRAYVARKKRREAESEAERKRAETARLLEYVASVAGGFSTVEPSRSPPPKGKGKGKGKGKSKKKGREGGGEAVSASDKVAAKDAVLRRIREKDGATRGKMKVVLEENKRLREELKALREEQTGRDDAVWAVVAPTRMSTAGASAAEAATLARSPGGPDLQRLSPAAKVLVHKTKLAKSRLGSVEEKSKELQLASAAAERMLGKLGKERDVINEAITELRLAKRQLGRQLNVKKARNEETAAALAKTEARCLDRSAAMTAAFNAQLKDRSASLHDRVHDHIQKARSVHMQRFVDDLKKEEAILNARLEKTLHDAILVNKEVATLRRELDRLQNWNSLRDDTIMEL